MKKRALSMLLALSLCFTLFSGIGSAALPSVDSVIDRAGDVLEATRADQLQVIAEMANQAVVQAIEGEEDPNAVNADVKAFVDTVIPETLFNEGVGMETIYPYFVLRYLQDGNGGYDAATYPTIAGVIKEMEDLDHNYNTSYNYETGEVIGLKKAFSMFNGYQKKLNDIVKKSQAEGALELAELGLFDKEKLEYKYNPVIYTYAKEVIAKSFAYFTPALYAQNGEDLSNTYDSIMNVDPADDDAIKATDIAKKNLSLVLGQDLLDTAMGGGMVGAAKDYYAAKKGKFVELVTGSTNYQNVYSADSKVAVAAAEAIISDLAAYVLAAKAEPGDSEAVLNALKKIEAIKAALVERGSDAVAVLTAAFKLAEAADTNYADEKFIDAGYRAVGLDIILKSFVGLYDLNGVSPVSTLKNGDSFSVMLYNDILKNRLNVPAPLPAGDLTLVSLTEGVELEAFSTGWEITYDSEKAPATADIAIYRGKADVADGGADVVDAATFRYIKTVKVNLVTKTPEIPDIEVKITNKPAIEKTFGHGQKVVVEGTVKGLDAALIGVQYLDELPEGFTGGKNLIAPATLAIDENGNFTYEFDLAVIDGKNVAAAKPYGEYQIVVGQADNANAEWRYTDTANFKINVMIVSEDVKNDTKTVAKNKKADYVLSQFAAKNSALTVTLKTDDGKTAVLDYAKAPEKFPNIAEAVGDQYDAAETKTQIVEGVQYEIPADWADYAKDESVDGVVELTIKRPSSGTTGGPGVSKSITLDRSVLKSEYYPGEGITIRGTSRGYTTITVTVTNPDGTKWTFTITPEEFAAGYILRLTEPGVYQIDVEGEKFTVVIVALDTNIFRKDHFNYIIGYEDGTVRPEANISREEVAAILYRLLTDDVRTGFYQDSTNAYSDVEADRWSMANIATLNNMGIIKGYEDNTFRPGRAITRAEFAALLSRLVVKKDSAPAVIPSFTDVDSHWAINEIYVVAAQGWFLGDTAGTFRPDDRITRAEAMTVINRVLGRDKVTTESFEGIDIVEFTDLAADAWYYVQVVEATNAHDFAKDETSGEETWTASKDETNWAE
ncbi:MAG: S-layer homology domain-containing protein [Oscillospiraceae bacterium]|nr:S-layer homology domain-containing protein [Oscillospiraceae bacterium]